MVDFYGKWIGEYTIYMDSIGIWMIGATRYSFFGAMNRTQFCVFFFPESTGCLNWLPGRIMNACLLPTNAARQPGWHAGIAITMSA